MGKLGDGYGSEFHLHDYLDARRDILNWAVKEAVGAEQVEWLPGPPHPNDQAKRREWKALNFLGDDPGLLNAWRKVWPSTGNPQNWDAVGRVLKNGVWEWLLVEAKAHLGEVNSSCTAVSTVSRDLIASTLAATKQALGVSPGLDWMTGYYQYCNRLAVLNFLRVRGIAAHLLFVYFTGDKSGPRRICPRTHGEWSEVLEAQKKHVGLPEAHPLQDRVHGLFLPVGRPVATHASE